ncbi:17129_t:CDS:2, partial [Gigaspora margarita]
AGYLASVYSNVYVDIGLVFPKISASGQQASLRELLEICPNGHYHPESFYVAAIQGREALSKFVRVGYMECSSQYRFHIVPIDRFQNYIVNHGVTIMRALTALPYYADIVPKDVGVTATGELLMKPDLKLVLKILLIIDYAHKELGITFLVGTELEFILLKNISPPVPVDDTVYAAASAFHESNFGEILDRMVESLQEQGIEVEQFHSEAATADSLVVARQTIYDVAAQAGVKATFKVVDDHPTGLSPYERSFIAGVLHHIKAIRAFALPTDHSYTRTVDNCWAGSWICWSVENR